MATPTTLPASFTDGTSLPASSLNNLRGAFRVLQVVSASYSTQAGSGSSTFADTGLTCAITPQSATSQVLVIVNQAGLYKDTTNTWVRLQLLRGSTVLEEFESYGAFNSGTGPNGVGGSGTTWLDSPATTSATTYKTQYSSGANTGAAFVQVAGGRSTITLLEISA